MAFPFMVAQTFLENWPDELVELSVNHEKTILSLEDTLALGSFTPEFRKAMNAYGDYELSDDFLSALKDAVAKFPDGVMPRIGYCSWKDSCLLNEPAKSVRQVLSIITRPNPKIATALLQNTIDSKETALFLRRWITIPGWAEFRLFMKERRFYGISQYYHRDQFPEIEQNLVAIRAALVDFCIRFRELSHMDTVVVDVFIQKSQQGLEARLIELNPFGERCDPCLYSWSENDFDGCLRFRRGSQIMTVKLNSAA